MLRRWHARHGVLELPGWYTHPLTTRVIPIPVSQWMQAANKSGIHLLGAIIVEFSLPDTKTTSKQMVYVTPSVTRLFLSSLDLGLISPSTPTAAAASSIPLRLGSPHSTPSPPSGNGKASQEQRTLQTNTYPPPPPVEKRTCECPTRSLPPTGPIPLFVPATEENRSALEQHLRSTFKASTFNVCTHQPLRNAPASQCGPEGNTSQCAHCLFTGRTQSKSTSTAMSISGYWKKSWSAHLTPRQSQRRPMASRRFPTPQPPCNERDTSHEVSVQPGTQCPQGGEEERVRRVEWIPLSAITPGGHALYYIYRTLGTVPLPDCPPGVQSVR